MDCWWIINFFYEKQIFKVNLTPLKITECHITQHDKTNIIWFTVSHQPGLGQYCWRRQCFSFQSKTSSLSYLGITWAGKMFSFSLHGNIWESKNISYPRNILAGKMFFLSHKYLSRQNILTVHGLICCYLPSNAVSCLSFLGLSGQYAAILKFTWFRNN